MPLRIHITRGRALVLVLSSLLLSYLAISLALTLLAPKSVSSNRDSFFSLTGKLRDGWTTPTIKMSEPWVLASTVSFGWRFEPWRGDRLTSVVRLHNGPLVSGEYSVNSKEPIWASFSGTTLERLRRGISGAETELETLNPFEAEGRGLLGARLAEVLITPNYSLLLAAPKKALLPVFLITVLLCTMTLTTYQRRSHSLSLLPALVTLCVSGFALSTSYPGNWRLAIPLWCFLMLLLTGVLLFRFGALAIRRTAQSVEISASKPFHPSARNIKIALGLIMLGGLAVRLYGLDFGLPHFFHPDEFRKARIVQTMIENGDPDPDYFKHPSFLLYGTAATTLVSRSLFGGELTRARVAYCGRLVSTILGTLSILLLFMIGRTLYDERIGLLSAALLAFCPLHVVCSRYMKEDSSFLFFTLLSAFFAITMIRTRHIRYLLLAGLAAGFAASAKYSGMLTAAYVFIPAAAAVAGIIALRLNLFPDEKIVHTLRRWVSSVDAKQIVIATPFALALIGVGFLLITPYSILNSQRFFSDFLGEKRHMEFGHNYPITASAQFWMYHAKNSFSEALSPFTALLSVIACGWLLVRRRWADLFVLASILLFYLPAEWVKAKPEPQPERYILPCLPFLILAGSVFIVGLSRFRNRALTFTVLVLAAASPLVSTVAHAASIVSDTRDQAAAWIRANIPAGTPLAIDWGYYSATVLDGDYPIIQLKDARGIAARLKPDYLRALDAQYLVISSFTYERYFKSEHRLPVQDSLRQLFTELPVVQSFGSPLSYGFHNPTIRIISLRELRELKK